MERAGNMLRCARRSRSSAMSQQHGITLRILIVFRVFRAFRGWSFFLLWETNHGTHRENTERKPVHCAQNTGLSCSIYTPPCPVLSYQCNGIRTTEHTESTEKSETLAPVTLIAPIASRRRKPAFAIVSQKNANFSKKQQKMYEQTVNTPLTGHAKSWPFSSLFGEICILRKRSKKPACAVNCAGKSQNPGNFTLDRQHPGGSATGSTPAAIHAPAAGLCITA